MTSHQFGNVNRVSNAIWIREGLANLFLGFCKKRESRNMLATVFLYTDGVANGTHAGR